MRRLVAKVVLLALALAACGTVVERREKDWKISSAWPRMARDFHLELATHVGSIPSNQLRFVVLPDPTASLVQLDVRVDVGAAQDPPGKRGLAHLTEHVLFLARPGGAGTPRLEALLRAATVSHNAYTNLESTHYQNLLRPDQLQHVLELEAARFGADACRSVDAKTFERERDVVRNELRERQIGAGGALAVLSRASYGGDHPYTSSPGGSDTEVAALTLDDVCRFVDTYYAPGRLVVVIAGRLETAATLNTLAQRFGALARRPAAPLVRVAPARGGGERRRLEADVDSSYLVWTFPVPARHNPLGLESQLMIDDVDSALGDVLASDKRVADYKTFLGGGERAPFVVVAVELAENAAPDAVETVVRDRLTLFSNAREASEQEYDWAPTARVLQHRFFMRLLFRLESLGARTDLFADYLQLAPLGTSYATEYARLADDKLHLAEARALYEPMRAARFLLVPSARPTHTERAATAFTGEEREEKEDLDVDASEAGRALHVPELADDLPDAHRFILDNGLTVILQPSPTVVPLVVAKLVFGVGHAHEPADKAGLADLAAHTFARGSWVSNTTMYSRFEAHRHAAGTLGLTGADTAEEIDDDVDVSPDNTEITVRFPANDTADVLHVLAFRLNAFVDPAYVDRLLSAWEQTLHKARRGLGSISAFAFASGVFGPGHPYARTTGMTLRSLMRIEPEDVVRFIDEHYVGANATLILTGAFDPNQLEEGIRDEFGRWPTGVHSDVVRAAARERKAPLFLGVDEGEDEDDDADATQVELTLGYPAPAGVDNHRAARLVLARMLDLRAEAVRERIGASYGLVATLVTSVGPGAYVVSGDVDPTRAGESLALLRAGIAELRRGKGFDEDFARARRFVLAELLARSSSPSALAARWAFLDRFGRDAGYFDGLARAVAALDPGKVHELIDDELASGHEVVVLTGSRAAVTRAYAQAGLPAPHFMKRWPPPRRSPKK
jgi:zinc protease